MGWLFDSDDEVCDVKNRYKFQNRFGCVIALQKDYLCSYLRIEKKNKKNEDLILAHWFQIWTVR